MISTGCQSSNKQPFVLELFKTRYVLPSSLKEALVAHSIPYKKGNKITRFSEEGCEQVSVSYKEGRSAAENLLKPIWGYTISYPYNETTYEEVKKYLDARLGVSAKVDTIVGTPAHTYDVNNNNVTIAITRGPAGFINTGCIRDKMGSKGYVLVHLCYDLDKFEFRDYVTTNGRQIYDWFN